MKSIFLKDYTPPLFFIEFAELIFILDPDETLVISKLYIKKNNSNTDSLVLDGINLNLQEIKLNDNVLSKNNYKVNSEHLTITKVPDSFVLEVSVKINPKQNLTCTGLYLTDNNFCTQNEPCGFRHITYFIDRPDILTKFTATIIADKTNYPVLLSNGNLIAENELSDNKHSVTWQDPFPKSAYLFALVAGKYGYIEDNYMTSSNRKILLRIFANPMQLEQCHHAMSSLKLAMAWEEKNFDLEYDLDIYQIVAVDDFNAGAMENKSLNIFNSRLLLASQASSTDADFSMVTAVVAHEYFHNWTGNRVTCRDWFQIGLKEGLTTLREQLFMEDTYGQAINRIGSIKTIRTRQFAEDSGPLSHPIRLQSYIEINNFYTVTVYNKSAEVARMLCTIFGRETFHKIMKEFLQKYDGQAVTIEDFLCTASLVTKTNLDQFKLWYDQAGTPVLDIGDDFANKTYTLKIKQAHRKSQKNFYMPLVVGFINQNGDNTNSETLIIDQNEQVFPFPNQTCKPVPSLSRNFSAPVKINYSYSDDELVLLMLNDQDHFNAWDASQRFMTNIILHLYHNLIAKKPYALPIKLINAFKNIINNTKIDLALKSQMLQLPTENYLIEILPRVEVEAIHNISEFIKLEIAKALKTELLECYKNNIENNKLYGIDAISIGKRSLKNLCLHYLLHLNTHDVFALCLNQLEHSNNMTDVHASLIALSNSGYPKWEQVLENYYQQWQHQPNLVDKWLALNANIKLPGTLERVKNLTSHQMFNIKNPNKVYALIRAFCENNHINFHAEDGAGYKFLADQVIIIDKFNPQLAAAIVSPLTRGYKHDKKREQLLREQMARINQEPKLSKNVYEILNKAV